MTKPPFPRAVMTWACMALLSLPIGQEARGADTLALKLSAQGMYMGYSGSPTRANLTSSGVLLDMQYLDRGGILAGGDYTTLRAKGAGQSITQNSAFVAGYVHMTPDSLPGRLTLRMDLLGVSNNDRTNETDQVRLWAPRLSYLSRGKSFYLDAGYADSRYGDSINPARGTLHVKQWAPAVGFGFNQNADWLQFRLYDIRNTNALRSANKTRTTAVEASWTHYFKAGGWMPELVQFGVLGGERMYAFDPDTQVVYNLTDLQKEGVTLGARWKLGGNTRLHLSTGHNRYESPAAGTPATHYTGTYGYAGLSFQW